jgi:hypothetical protein
MLQNPLLIMPFAGQPPGCKNKPGLKTGKEGLALWKSLITRS